MLVFTVNCNRQRRMILHFCILGLKVTQLDVLFFEVLMERSYMVVLDSNEYMTHSRINASNALNTMHVLPSLSTYWAICITIYFKIKFSKKW